VAIILKISEIKKTSLVGNKTRMLKVLKDSGFKVPDFVAIPSSVVRKIINGQGVIQASLINQLLDEARQTLNAPLYTVRSSALIEDGSEESFAGQFKTRINLKPSELFQAVSEVLTQAREYLKGDLNLFSLIIQEYIEAEFSGVTFTRNPQGGRQMVLEYHLGKGEDLVGGKIIPEHREWFWHQKPPETLLPNLKKISDEWKKIEQIFDFPQDIEWCVKNNEYYFLQTRAVTSISAREYKQIRYLDDALPKKGKFFYKKTEISEAVPRPTTLMLDILKNFYGENGPVQKVYRKNKIKYVTNDFLKVLGNELFVDRELELKTLLPAYTFFSGSDLKPRFKHVGKIFVTLKNLVNLQKVSLKDYERIFSDLKFRIEETGKEKGVQALLKNLIDDYELVFEINLLSGIALNRLDAVFKKQKISVVRVLSQAPYLFPDLLKQEILFPLNNAIGNSLDLLDESVFVRKEVFGSAKKNEEFDSWWEKQTLFKKNYFSTFIKDAYVYSRLREYGRWLVVKRVHLLRKALVSHAKRIDFSDPNNIFFVEYQEILQKNISEDVCKKRMRAYSEYGAFELPSSLSHEVVKEKLETRGVSEGVVVGEVVSINELDKRLNDLTDKILYTKILSPELTHYFGKVKGIISETGGLLSHLAIIAREHKIPVVVNCPQEKIDGLFGKKIEINGESGEIKTIIDT
jgi:phosphohistidine swiveling domain-containing protein